MGKIQKLREQKKIEEQFEQEEKIKHNKKIVLGVLAAIATIVLLIFGANKLFPGGKKIASNTSPATTSASAAPSPTLAQIFPQISSQPTAPPKPSGQTNMPKTTVVSIETAKGNIVLELYDQDAPKTVANFINLINKKFYDGLTFHRVVPGFVVQGGDPQGNGMGGPGYTFADEINPWSLGLSDSAIQSLQAEGYKYTKDIKSHKVEVGSLAMADSGPDTNGSQFFIVTTQPQPHLDGRHTVFGQVIMGLDVVRKIQQGDTMKSVKIFE